MSDEMQCLIDGRVEPVAIDQEYGPVVLLADGTTGFMRLRNLKQGVKTQIKMPDKRWPDMTLSEQKTLAHMAAKKNIGMRNWKGADFWKKAMEEVQGVALTREELDSMAKEHRAARCSTELSRHVSWRPITLDTVQQNHAKRGPGMIYGLEFPFTEEMLISDGPEWLTQAFRASGVLDTTNKVTKVVAEKKIKITAGNNAGKFLFEVRYARKQPHLHTLLFAKIPFAMSPETKSDRLSSSVYKQPMDLMEINTYRLLEASLPFRVPKFYYGDISNDTSNFILITERIPYAEIHGFKKHGLEPYDIEGPYDKCMDWQLTRRTVKEYYLLLMRMQARVAGEYQSGKIRHDIINQHLTGVPPGKDRPDLYGFNPVGNSGENPVSFSKKVDSAIRFFGETAKVVYPKYCQDDAWKESFTNTIMTWNAYSSEVEYFKYIDPNYVALGHNNLNIDNAYFWKDPSDTLDCGIIDFGGFGVSNLGHKIYWCLNCSEFENIRDNLDDYIAIFVAEYSDYGGPLLDPNIVYQHILLTMIANCNQMMQAIPNCFKMCAAKEWETIKDRNDPRIAGNIDGKSTLRSTLRQTDNGVRIIQEMDVDTFLSKWIQDIFVGVFKQEPKHDSVIFGTSS